MPAPDDAATRLLPLVLSAGNFAVGMGAFVVIGLMGPLAARFGLTPGEAGFILTAYAVAYAVGSPVLVALTGGWDRRRVLLLGLALFMAGAAATALAPSTSWLYAARVTAAVGAGLFTPVSAAVAAGLAAPGRQGAALSTVFAGLTFAQVLGVPAGAWIGYSFGWQAAFAVVAALSALSLAAVAALAPRGIAFRANSLATLGAALRDGPILVTALYTASFLGAIYIVYTLLAPLLAERMGYGRDGVTAVLAAFGLGAVAGNMLGGRLSDRIGPGRTLALLAAAQAVILPVFSLLPVPDAALMGLAFLWALFGWSFMAPQQARMIRRAPGRENVALALNAAAIYLGATLGSALGAAVAARFGLGALGFAAGAAALVAMLHLAASERWR